jgi:hypothetical protein
MARKKQTKVVFAPDDVFLVPLGDGTSSVGQVLAIEQGTLGSVLCAFFDLRLSAQSALKVTDLSVDHLTSILFVSNNLLEEGAWNVLANIPHFDYSQFIDIEKLRAKKFVGIRVVGCDYVAEFLRAYHALCPWNDWHDPAYLDTLLISSDKKPKHLVMKNGKNTRI